MNMPCRDIKAPLFLSMIGSFGFLGGRRIISLSGGSNPSPRAGKLSVTRLTQRIWIGRSGTGQPTKEATNMTIISPKLQDRR